jgi:hypothetical protein
MIREERMKKWSELSEKLTSILAELENLKAKKSTSDEYDVLIERQLTLVKEQQEFMRELGLV